jgi:serine/threonine-protein kinase RsbW
MRTYIFPAKFEHLDELREFAAQAARDAGMDDSETYAVQLAVDEACSNIIEHAYECKEEGEIECTCDANEEALVVVLKDHGLSFDPGDIPDPDLEASLKDRKIGGLGIYMMRKLMDDVHFEAMGKLGNVLTMTKRRKGKGK